MTACYRKTKIFNLSILSVVFLLSSIVSFAQTDAEVYKSRESKVDLTMIGGYAHSESIGGMSELNLEIKFSFSSRVRLGMGLGYLNGNDDLHMNGNFGSVQSGMMGGMGGGMMGGFSGHNHTLKVVPITLSLYYALPINTKLDVFMLGGGGYYIGSYRDQSTQSKSSLGPHAGLGINFKLSDRIGIVAEALYRFVSLKGFTSELHEGFIEGVEGELESGFWHYHHQDAEWHFHEEIQGEQQMLMDNPPFDISLSGVSLRIGIIFGF